jgi:hypothetical protein
MATIRPKDAAAPASRPGTGAGGGAGAGAGADGGAAALRDAVDGYLAAVAAHDPKRLPLAKRVRFTEMGQALELGDGFWHTATGIGNYKLYFPDPAAREIGFIGTMREYGNLVLMALRLRVERRRISEIETVFYRKGSGPAWNDSGMDRLDAGGRVDPVWLEAVPPAERMSRAELARIANLYFVGLEGNDGKGIDGKGFYPFAEDCLRIENGVQTTSNPNLVPSLPPGAFNYFALDCAQQFKSGYLAVVTRIHHRRFMAVDPKHGTVFAWVVFDQAGTTSVRLASGQVIPMPFFNHPSSILLAEAFKIEKGLIRRIEAVGTGVPYHMSPGWEAGAVVPARARARLSVEQILEDRDADRR